MFDKYSPIDGKIYQVMDNNGKIIIPKYEEKLTNEQLVQAYKQMLFARTADLMAVSYQRQGRMFTYPPNLGQEAISIAAGMVVQENDWFIPAFRELSAWIAKGATLQEIFLYFKGNEYGSRFEKANRMLPVSVPIASQLLHGVGIAYAMKYKGEKSISFSVVGDGGTSEGDFHEACNFAAVWKVPAVLLIQNNQFAISVPLRMQTVSKSLAIKAVAYGMPGIQVDGNDLLAMYDVLQYAREYAIAGNGPVLIEAVTYRKGAHTTSDDPTRYRTKEEEESWEKKDPVKRLQTLLIKKKLWDPAEEEALIADYKKKIDNDFSAAENYDPYKLEDVFGWMFKEMPDELKRQKVAYEKFLQWKGAAE